MAICEHLAKKLYCCICVGILTSQFICISTCSAFLHFTAVMWLIIFFKFNCVTIVQVVYDWMADSQHSVCFWDWWRWGRCSAVSRWPSVSCFYSQSRLIAASQNLESLDLYSLKMCVSHLLSVDVDNSVICVFWVIWIRAVHLHLRWHYWIIFNILIS